MRTFDFTPYRRSTVGFDRLFEMLESSARAETETYPPFDIEQEGEDRYRITLAVAGFRPDPHELVEHPQLEPEVKRAILASWASDAFAVRSQPALRKPPELPRPVPVHDVLAALKCLDGAGGASA